MLFADKEKFVDVSNSEDLLTPFAYTETPIGEHKRESFRCNGVPFIPGHFFAHIP